MRVVYLGTPEDAVGPLEALVDAGHEVALVVTRPDRRRSRRGAPEPSPVRAAAERLGLPVETPASAGSVLAPVRASGAAAGVVVAYGQILPPQLLGALPDGFVNLHCSILPRWRGAAPVERAILAGDRETGVAVMAMTPGLDEGPVYATAREPIGPRDTAGALRARLIASGTDLLLAVLPDLRARVPAPQVGTPTYAAKLVPEDFRLDPALDAASLDRRVRAAHPRPGGWCTIGGRRLKVWRATPVAAPARPAGTLVVTADEVVLATARGGLRLDEVQFEGKPAMPAATWIRGRPELVGADVVVDAPGAPPGPAGTPVTG